MSRKQQHESKERFVVLVDSMYESSARFERLSERLGRAKVSEDISEIREDLVFMVQLFDSAKSEIINKLNDIKRPSLAAVKSTAEEKHLELGADDSLPKEAGRDRSRFQSADDTPEKQRSRDRAKELNDRIPEFPVQPSPSQYMDDTIRMHSIPENTK
jgi:hypothetical protein